MITEDTGITEADTPETNRNIVEIGFDVHGNPCRFVPVEFARRLECERDDAREMVKQVYKSQFGTDVTFLPKEDDQ